MEITKEGIESLGFKFHQCKSTDSNLTFSQKSAIEGYYLCLTWFPEAKEVTIIHHNYDFIGDPAYNVIKLYEGTPADLDELQKILNSDGIKIYTHPVKD